MEAMKIMGIPDEEQIGINPLKGLKMQGNERGNRSYLYRAFFILGFFFCLTTLVFLLIFVLSGVHHHPPTPHPLPRSEQYASNKFNGFGVTYLRIYQHSFNLYS